VFVFRTHFSVADQLQLFLEQATAKGMQEVDKESAIHMVVFVLDNSGQHAIKFSIVGAPFRIFVTQPEFGLS
jgi:hypothetical protein